MDGKLLHDSFKSADRLKDSPKLRVLTSQVKKWWKVDTTSGEQPELTEDNVKPYLMYNRTPKPVEFFKGAFTDAVE